MSRGRGTDQTGRSKKEKPRYALLNHDTMDMPAWRSLDAVARSTFLILLRRHNGNNNGYLPLSIREVGKELSIGKSTAAKAFDMLQRRGFIRAHVKSSFDWKTNSEGPTGRSTRWRITELKVGEYKGPSEMVPTREFALWLTPEDDYLGHIKPQKPVRPQVRGVPPGGQSVPVDGHSPDDGGADVPVRGRSGQKAAFGVPENGQYLSYQIAAAQELASSAP